MKLGRAYKLAALAAAHKARATACLDRGDSEGARREAVAYLATLDDIPGHFRQQVSPFLHAAILLKREVRERLKGK